MENNNFEDNGEEEVNDEEEFNEEEMIEEIIIPHYDLSTYWRKVGSRAAESISKVSFAGAYKIKDNKVIDLRIAFGSVSITAIRNREVEKKYIGFEKEALILYSPTLLKFVALVDKTMLRSSSLATLVKLKLFSEIAISSP